MKSPSSHRVHRKKRPVEAVHIELNILSGEKLTAKERNLFGKKTSPFVKVVFSDSKKCNAREVGRTKTIKKSLFPSWNDRIKFTISGKDLPKESDPTVRLQLQIFDEDNDEMMGVVKLSIPTSSRSSEVPPTWYSFDAAADSANKNAKGRLQVSYKAKVKKARTLIRGHRFELNTDRIMIGLAWDMIPGANGGRSRAVDLDVSCVAVTSEGKISMADTVYYGNLTNTNGSVTHSGDEQSGDGDGDDERIMVDLESIPKHIVAMYVVLSIATPSCRFPDVQSTKVRVLDVACNPTTTLCTFTPAQQALARNATAMFVARLGRTRTGSFEFAPIEDSHPTARDFGPLVPHMKRYTQDLIPNIVVDPTERVAIMRKGSSVRLEDYCKNGTIPSMVTFGLAWDVTNGVNIDLDASVICLDRNLELVDQVCCKKRQLESKDGAIAHGGDEREGDELGDDEKIHLFLGQVDPRIEYIGFVINSYSGQELDDVSRAYCHLFDPMDIDIANYAMTNCAAIDGYTALVVACLYRDPTNPESWGLSIISEPAMGKTVDDNVDELQDFLRRNPPQAPEPFVLDESEISLRGMPEHVPFRGDESETEFSMSFADFDIGLSKSMHSATSASSSAATSPMTQVAFV